MRGATDEPGDDRGALQGFQSTPPVRGATGYMVEIGKETIISIHAPRAGGDHKIFLWHHTEYTISIHAPRAGGDDFEFGIPQGATGISIHAPRAGGDILGTSKQVISRYISIHAPRAGGDATTAEELYNAMQFQSTPPVRGATNVKKIAGSYFIFQSTPPVRGATQGQGLRQRHHGNFNPRPPCGGRLCSECHRDYDNSISIHAPRAGGDPI